VSVGVGVQLLGRGGIRAVGLTPETALELEVLEDVVQGAVVRVVEVGLVGLLLFELLELLLDVFLLYLPQYVDLFLLQNLVVFVEFILTVLGTGFFVLLPYVFVSGVVVFSDIEVVFLPENAVQMLKVLFDLHSVVTVFIHGFSERIHDPQVVENLGVFEQGLHDGDIFRVVNQLFLELLIVAEEQTEQVLTDFAVLN